MSTPVKYGFINYDQAKIMANEHDLWSIAVRLTLRGQDPRKSLSVGEVISPVMAVAAAVAGEAR